MRQVVLTLVAVLIVTGYASAAPVGTAFTYQGQLLKSSSAYTGNADGIFRLYDAVSGGAQVGSTITTTSIPVSGGLFTVDLDFGSVFTGTALWLDIQVRTPPDAGYTTLTPRVRLAPSPFAMYALGGAGGGGLSLPFDGTTSTSAAALKATNSSSGDGLSGVSASGKGVFGRNSVSGNTGYLGGYDWAISGTHAASGNLGILGHQLVAVYGQHGGPSPANNYGGLGDATVGAYGVYTADGSYGYLGNQGIGVIGHSSASYGSGVDGNGYTGVYGSNTNGTGYGVQAWSNNGTGIYANSAHGYAGYFVSGSGSYAGYFLGDVNVNGVVYATAKYFRIDHPVEPDNKYLIHACVESDELKNVYDGVVTLDASGAAWVELPSWFESLNGAFRYQLTAIGAPGPDLYIAQKIQGNRFRIAGGKPDMEISWQVTGVRQDAYAKAKPMQVEVEKVGAEKGRYINPEVFGLPASSGIEYERLEAARSAAVAAPKAKAIGLATQATEEK